MEAAILERELNELHEGLDALLQRHPEDAAEIVAHPDRFPPVLEGAAIFHFIEKAALDLEPFIRRHERALKRQLGLTRFDVLDGVFDYLMSVADRTGDWRRAADPLDPFREDARRFFEGLLATIKP